MRFATVVPAVLLFAAVCATTSDDEYPDVNRADTIANGPSAEFRRHTELLETVLTLDAAWSHVWNEKINRVANELEPPPREACAELAAEFENDPATTAPIDTFRVIRIVVDHCGQSGLSVGYGANLVKHSEQCTYQRHVQVLVSHTHAVVYSAQSAEPAVAFIGEVVLLMSEVADKLAYVEAALQQLLAITRHLIELSRRVNDGTAELPRAAYDALKKAAKKLMKPVSAEFRKYCAVPMGDWYDEEGDGRIVQLVQAKVDEDEDGAAVLARAQSMLAIARSVFRRLFVQSMSADIWHSIFYSPVVARVVEMPKATAEAKTQRRMRNFEPVEEIQLNL